MGYSLGNGSRKELQGVHSDLIKVVERAIEITEQDFTVHDGIRTVEEQRRYVNTGVSTTMNSKHLPQVDGKGHAVDLVPYINGKLRWEWGPIYKIAAAVRQAAIELKVPLVWGGVWNKKLAELPATADGLEDAVERYVAERKRDGKRAFIDGPHYELVR